MIFALALLPALLLGSLCLFFAPFGQVALWSLSLLTAAALFDLYRKNI